MEKRPVLEVRFYETYYFASLVSNVLRNRFTYLRTLEGFYCDDQYLYFIKPFPRFSALHRFIRFLLFEVITEDTEQVDLERRKRMLEWCSGENFRKARNELKPAVLPIEEAFQYHHLDYDPFETWLEDRQKAFADAEEDDVCDYLNELLLCGPLEELLDRTVSEVFFVLFQNRRLLLLFQDMMADLISNLSYLEVDGYTEYLERDGVLKRHRPPSWVQRAVFYRDRGRCVFCQKDLTGLVTWNIENFDHIVPLSHGGLNDVTNIQLLCEECNRKKSDLRSETSDLYEAWYAEE